MSAPSGPIQLIPPGFLGLLALKNMGRLPDFLQGNVQPTLEMGDWYLRSAIEPWDQTSNVLVPAGAGGAFVPFGTGPITVPEGEWWFVHDYSVTAEVTNPDTAQDVALSWRYQGAGFNRFVVWADPYARTALLAPGAASSVRSAMYASGFWLPSGAELGVYTGVVTGATGVACTVRGLRFTRCPN